MRRIYLVGSFFLSVSLPAYNSAIGQTTPPTTQAKTIPTAATPPPAAVPAPTPKPAAPKPAPAPVTASTAAPASAPAAAAKPKVPGAKPAEPVAASTAPANYTGPIWKKQVTRDLELGEKIDSNQHKLRNASSDNTLLEMFAIGIKTGKVSSFYTSDFSMTTRIKATDFAKLFVGRPDTTAVRDAAGKYHAKVTNKEFNFADIHKYRILEEWTSYPGIGKTEVQIVGIAPLKDMKGPDGTVHDAIPLFWVHYTEDIKSIVARYEQYHPNNTLGGHLWADYFNTPTAK
jgi:hypothetical protein